MNIQHSSRTDLWYTPGNILIAARTVLGPIGFDPASDVFGNQRVMATTYYDEGDDGLTRPWPKDITVWVNPPGSKVGNKSKTGLFWGRLMQHRAEGKLKHAMFMCFSVEALQSTQNKVWPAIGEFPLCVPAKRIRFIGPDGLPGMAPSHSNAIVYVTGTVDVTPKFKRVFSSLGTVLNVSG